MYPAAGILSGVAHWKSVALSGLCSGIDTHPTSKTKFGSTGGAAMEEAGCSKEQREGDGLRNYLGVTLKIKCKL